MVQQWAAIPQKNIVELVESMPRKINPSKFEEISVIDIGFLFCFSVLLFNKVMFDVHL